ncbi:MAG: type II secretion system protein E [Candidatus Moranbacteria bacterium GW2011_GWA2_39_41]|nr:MAG: type II secretion system protein E [Candidatus Moranbacteria bacterium GW2011_GWA2_39_41]
MRIENKQLYEFIKDSELIKLEDLELAYKEAQDSSKILGDVLLEKKLIDEVKLRELYAYILGVPFVDLSKEIIPADILQIVPEPIAKKYKIVAFEKTGSELKIAMLNPEDIQTVDFIRKKTGLKIITCLTSEDSINIILKQYAKSLKAEFGDIIEKNSSEVSGDEKEDLEKVAQGLPIIRIVDTLIKHAILQGASDVHIEPDEKEVRVRYRIDGILHDAMTLPKQVKHGIIARIKVLSNLKLDEHRVPQDGRFKIEKDDLKISFRVSILPIFDGEKIVMRLLNENSKGLTLEKMGMTGLGLEIIHRQIKKPNGMILVTGPTGSGKTTTLYTIMDILNTPEVNISTVEDPVEYRMPRVNQTQIYTKVGLTFAAGLRSLLRQDPDIIMVGEIRDQETLEMAIHAALTGHLVLSTLHTNSAAATLPRIIDMGAEAFMVASTVNVIIAQRLVRKLCQDCKKEYQMTSKELEALGESYDMTALLEVIKKNENLKDLVGKKAKWEDVKLYKSVSCEQCHGEGYKGRSGIYEVLEVDDEIEKMISQKTPTEELEKRAREKGMLTMVEDGFVKAVSGITSIEEILRVTKE